jgi:hypothetical protein
MLTRIAIIGGMVLGPIDIQDSVLRADVIHEFQNGFWSLWDGEAV